MSEELKQEQPKKQRFNITQEVIERFLEGEDPMERIVNMTYNYMDDFVRVFYRDENDQKQIMKDPFKPFLWATTNACKRLCGGNKNQLRYLMSQYGIGIKKLSNINNEGVEVKEFLDGYMYMIYAQKKMSYNSFLNFFKKAQNPVYQKKGAKENPELKDQYIVVTPIEQHMIATGKRFFKGYDDYDSLLRMEFDLETTGLDKNSDKIVQLGVRLNRPIPSRPNGFQKIFTVEGDTEEAKRKCRKKVIATLFKIIQVFQPDIVTGHNIESFDIPMIEGNCVDLGTTMEEISSKYFNGETAHKEKRETILKLGGEIETFKPTVIPNTIVTDSLHAVRRAQAIDSSMQQADLKYATEYADLKKENRVYTPGDKIFEIWNDTEHQFAFNDSDGDWYIYDPESPNGVKTREEFKNDEDYEGYLKSMKGKQGNKPFKMRTRNVLMDGYELTTGRYIIERYLYDDLYEGDRVEWKFNATNFLICKILPVPYKKCTTMGTAGQWKSIMLAWSYKFGLAIPPCENTGSFTGGLSRLLKTGFVKNVIKLDYNSLYPSILLTWGIHSKTDLLNAMLLLLEYVLTTREKYKGQKKAAEKKVDSVKIKVKNNTATAEEIHIFQEASAAFALADGKQSQMKVLGNSYFGSFGSNIGYLFPWKSVVCAEQTTCTGRQSLRLMISHFTRIGYEPIVGDTDGFNFKLPDTFRYTDEQPYIGKGLNREVKKGESYTGYKADVAEFNDMYMGRVYNEFSVQKMGLGIDEIVSSTINFSRKNYADYFPDNPYPKDVKLVGNTVKSKRLNTYIAKFLDVAVRQLLRGDGQAFIEEYYSYIDKIYNFNIPIRDIATKGKIKKSISQYLESTKELTKAGRPKSRQAWYELAIRDKIDVVMGETLYYINTGKKKSQNDLKKNTYYVGKDMFGAEVDKTKEVEKMWRKYLKDIKATGEEKKDKETWLTETFPDIKKKEEVELRCQLVPRQIIDADDDMYCYDLKREEYFEYNRDKYIDMFNKRITPLLVCFSRDIRNDILITNPADRKYFTKEQCELVSGQPNKPSDQDTYEQLMTMEDKEIRFWTANNLVPPFLEECGMGKWEDIVADYNKRMEEERQLGIDKEKEAFTEALNKLSMTDINDFIEDEKIHASIAKICTYNTETTMFMSKAYPDYSIASANDFFERLEFLKKYSDDLFEASGVVVGAKKADDEDEDDGGGEMLEE